MDFKRYQVRVPDSFAHAMAGKQMMDTEALTTVIKSASGGTYKEFPANQVVSLTVEEGQTRISKKVEGL